MPEIRRDPLLGQHVVFAPERAQRPFELDEAARSTSMQPSLPLARCPFCRGHEADTTESVWELQEEQSTNARDWIVRVIPNRYPALIESAASEPTGFGRHEVIIEAPQHVTSMASLTVAQYRGMARAYRQRLQVLRAIPAIQHASLFKNDGAGAGASLEHVHSQLIATPFVSPQVARELSAAKDYYSQQARCWFCDLGHAEAKSDRHVFSTEEFVCWCPYASRFAAEMCLMPRRHRAAFDELEDAELDSFADALRDCVCRLQQVLPNVAFNWILHTAPFRDDRSHAYHWHVEILPRVMGLAGFELGAGCPINTLLPEIAAQQLANKRTKPRLMGAS